MQVLLVQDYAELGISIAAANCHLFQSESGGPAIHAQVMCKPIQTITGIFTAVDIQNSFQLMEGINKSTSKIVSVENTTNLGGAYLDPRINYKK